MELRPADLAAEWKAGKFRPVYYLFGEESASKSDAVLKLKELFKPDDFNLADFGVDSSFDHAAVLAEALTLPVFADRRLVIARNPKIPAEARAAFAEYLSEPSKSTTLVLLCEDRRPDKKDALASAALSSPHAGVCVFSPLTEDEAVERLIAEAKKAGKTMAPEAAAAVVEEAGTDWGILSGELEKAILFAGKEAAIGLEAVSAASGKRGGAADPWAFEKLVSARDLKACLGYLDEAHADSKPEEVVFRALAQARAAYLKQLKAKRLLKAGESQFVVEKKLRIFYDNTFFQRAARVTEDRLRRDLRRLLEVETSLKSKAWLDPKIELTSLVVELCTPTAR
jgi:DNA polymerase-3 subunit delta